MNEMKDKKLLDVRIVWKNGTIDVIRECDNVDFPLDNYSIMSVDHSPIPGRLCRTFINLAETRTVNVVESGREVEGFEDG